MKLAPIPKNEKERLFSLYELGILDTEPEERFDRITRTATKIFNVPISTLTLVDSKREWFKSVCGLDQKEGERAISFCGHALFASDVFVILDTTKDNRFRDNPMVIGKPYIRFYAGVPIMNVDGERIGVLCIKDTKPRKFSKKDEEILKNLGTWADLEINSRNLSFALSDEQKKQSELNTRTKEAENAKIAARNILEDLTIEKSKVEIASAKEKAMLFSIGDGFIATDEEGNITFINRTAEELLDIKSEEVMGKVYSEVILIEDEKGVRVLEEKRPLKIALTTGTPTITNNFEGLSYYYLRKDKTKFPVAIIATPIIIKGKVSGAVEVFRDITIEKEIDRAKSEFVSLASHQLRTPLTTISWYTEMILDGDVGKVPPGQRKYLKEIYKGNERMIELVNTLLNVSRIELGTFIITPYSTDIIMIARNVLNEQKFKVKNKKLVIIENFISNIPKFLTDPKLLRIVFQNILSNAVEYTPRGGKIEFTISYEDPPSHKATDRQSKKNILIKISDSGYGIPRNQQDQIFTKFFRADNVRDKDTSGTGLGLYIVKSVVENAGGKIWFESPASPSLGGKENPGTTFYVSFPFDAVKTKENTK